MKVLTLHQPWASLIACGVKTIETRSWSTRYRGPLAIHAAARKPDVEMLEDGLAGDAEWGQWYETDARDYMPPVPPAAKRWSLALAPEYDPVTMPLGAIVTTSTLVDVVPIHERLCSCKRAPVPYLLRGVGGMGREVLGLYRPDGLGIGLINGNANEHPWVAGVDNAGDPITDQLPYGDFRCGRYAWLLADIVPVDPPVPFKGGQGLTKTWEPMPA